MNWLQFTVLCLLCIFTSVNGSSISLNELSPTHARDGVGDDVNIPCDVKIEDSIAVFEMQWKRKTINSDEYEVLVGPSGDISENFKDKISTKSELRKDYKTYYLILKNLQKADEGTYYCSFEYENRTQSHAIDLGSLDYYNILPYYYGTGVQLVDDDMKNIYSGYSIGFNSTLMSWERISWSYEFSCNDINRFTVIMPDGDRGAERKIPVGCDPLSSIPCCGPIGWCGFTQEHCLCTECVDYRKVPDPVDKFCEEFNMFTCSKVQCIDHFSQCDGRKHCINGVDEELCETKGQFEEVQTSLVAVAGKSYSLPCKVTNLGEDEEIFLKKVVKSTELGNNVYEVKNLSNRSSAITVKYLYFSKIGLEHVGNYSCEIRNSERAVKFQFYDIHVCEVEDPVLCKEDSSCISKSQICDGVANCKLGSDEQNCPATEDSALKCLGPENCSAPFFLIDGKCIHPLTNKMSWFDAQTTCRGLLSKLVIFRTVNEIISFQNAVKNSYDTRIESPTWTAATGHTHWSDSFGELSQSLFHPEIVPSCAYLSSLTDAFLTKTERCNEEKFVICEKSIVR